MNRVLVYTITRANTVERSRLLLETLTRGRETCGHTNLHWHVHVNGRGIMAQAMVEACFASRVIDSFAISDTNEGQHPPANRAIKQAIDEGYDYLLRTDDDVEWLSKRWLAKLVEASEKVGGRMVLSPKVKGLRWQPPQSQTVQVEGIPIKIINFKNPIGGICRLTPVPLLKEKPYVSNVRLPMGGGDAAGVGNWVATLEPLVVAAYAQHLNIRHAKGTDQQELDDPEHAKEHDIFQHCPFIPALA
jgi:hypothetical protein